MSEHLADQLEAACEEVERLKSVAWAAVADDAVRSRNRAESERDELRSRVDGYVQLDVVVTAERTSLRAEVELLRGAVDLLRVECGQTLTARNEYQARHLEALAEHDSLRQQLEAVQRDAAHPCIHNPCSDCRTFEASTGTRSDRTHAGEVEALAAVQRRIAELEAEAVEADERWAKRLDELESENARLIATLRATLPVYRAADGNSHNLGRHVSNNQLCDALAAARAAITPEIAAVLDGLEAA